VKREISACGSEIRTVEFSSLTSHCCHLGHFIEFGSVCICLLFDNPSSSADNALGFSSPVNARLMCSDWGQRLGGQAIGVGAATMSIVRSGEPAPPAVYGSSAPAIRTDAPSSAMRGKSCWTKPASNPIHRQLTESVGSGFKSATLLRPPVQRGFKRARWRGQNLKITPEGHKTYLFVLGHKLLSSLCQIIRGTPLLLTPSYC